MNNNLHAIDKLPVFRLNAMLEHIRLGDQNLKKTLTAYQYNEFLQFIASYENHHENAFLACLERVGNMTLVANTVTSSTFGSWLAISGAMGFGSVSLQALFLAIGISFSLSLWGALSSYRVLKHEANEKLMSQRLLHFQAKILKEIDKKKFFEIMKAVTDLNKNLDDDSDKMSNSKKDLLIWAKKMEIKVCGNAESFKSKKTNKTDFVDVLSKPWPDHRAKHGHKKNYFQPIILRRMVDLLSITIGGFASSFVYTTGIPDIAKKLGYMEVYTFLVTSNARIAELMLAIVLTSYFGFSYLYSSYKNSKRDKLVEKAKKMVAHEEAEVAESETILNVLHKINSKCNEA